MYLYLLIFFIVVLISYSYFTSPNLIEGLENDNLDGDVAPKTIIYQNQGAIQYLKEQVEKLMEHMNSTVNIDAKQSADIQQLQSNVTAITKVSNEADKIAKSNRIAIKKTGDAKKKEADEKKKQASKLQPIK